MQHCDPIILFPPATITWTGFRVSQRQFLLTMMNVKIALNSRPVFTSQSLTEHFGHTLTGTQSLSPIHASFGSHAFQLPQLCKTILIQTQNGHFYTAFPPTYFSVLHQSFLIGKQFQGKQWYHTVAILSLVLLF